MLRVEPAVLVVCITRVVIILLIALGVSTLSSVLGTISHVCN